MFGGLGFGALGWLWFRGFGIYFGLRGLNSKGFLNQRASLNQEGSYVENPLWWGLFSVAQFRKMQREAGFRISGFWGLGARA